MTYTKVSMAQLYRWFPFKDFDLFITAWASEEALDEGRPWVGNGYLIHLENCGSINQVAINLIHPGKGFWGRGERCTCAKDGVASFLVQELMVTDPGLHYAGVKELFKAIKPEKDKNKHTDVEFAGYYTTLLSFQAYKAGKDAHGVS